MKTNQFIPVVLFIFGVSASAVYAFPPFPESPVYEQRKALYEKNKKVYGSKTTVNSESAAADQGTGDDKDKAKEKDKKKDSTKGAKKGAIKRTTKAKTDQNVIPPPSKNLLKLKKAHEQASKKKPDTQSLPTKPDTQSLPTKTDTQLLPVRPDVVGTVSPQTQK